jgi:KaiC domain protein
LIPVGGFRTINEQTRRRHQSKGGDAPGDVLVSGGETEDEEDWFEKALRESADDSSGGSESNGTAETADQRETADEPSGQTGDIDEAGDDVDDDPFGGASDDSDDDPFGGASNDSEDDPFGGASDDSEDDPFGGASDEGEDADDDPFGGTASAPDDTEETDDPFGGSTGESDDPFGGVEDDTDDSGEPEDADGGDDPFDGSPGDNGDEPFGGDADDGIDDPFGGGSSGGSDDPFGGMQGDASSETPDPSGETDEEDDPFGGGGGGDDPFGGGGGGDDPFGGAQSDAGSETEDPFGGSASGGAGGDVSGPGGDVDGPGGGGGSDPFGGGNDPFGGAQTDDTGGPGDDPFGEDFAEAMGGAGGGGGFGGGGGGGPADFDEEEFESEIDRLDIGIEGLDDMILGGVPVRSLITVIGSAGTGKTTFGLQFLDQAMSDGGKGVYITLEETEDAIISTAEEKGWPFGEYVDNGQLVVVAMDPIEMANSLDSIRGDISRLVNDFGADRLVLDSVSLLEMMYDHPAKRRSEVFDFARSLKRAGVTTMLTSEANADNAYQSRHGLVEYLVDAVFILQYVRPSDFQETRLAVEIQKIRDANHSRETKPYDITDDGISVHRQANIF